MISLEYPFCHVQRNMFARKSSFFSEFLHCLFLYLQDNQYYIVIFHSDCLLVSDCHKVPVCIFVASFCALTKFRRFFNYFDSWGQSSNSRRLKMINAKQTGRQLTQSLSCFVFSNDDSDPGVLQILRFGNSAWDLSGVNIWSGIFFGFWFFAPIPSSPSLEIWTIPPPPTPQGQWQQWECQKFKFIKLKLCTCTKLFGTFLSWSLLNYGHDKFSSAIFQRHRKHTIWRVILSYITRRCGP